MSIAVWRRTLVTQRRPVPTEAATMIYDTAEAAILAFPAVASDLFSPRANYFG
jgi:hypothetical protein